MKMQLILKLVAIWIAMSVSLVVHAHEGHASAGVVHELHHALWVVMAMAVSAVAVFLLRKSSNTQEESED
ncbi:hypothetical protein KUV22_07370 [Microbulbifer agarilyticus]|uniref:hypothetical protein n=1 Tax=Microbulbifer agarilyticus TaxID=260552 RepID=UPI001C93E789|nr:hypothetical protein [Microbulbifer agarilyticus]MBY6190237.1 hypothetical protein [Microbulbifer agarilyticus]